MRTTHEELRKELRDSVRDNFETALWTSAIGVLRYNTSSGVRHIVLVDLQDRLVKRLDPTTLRNISQLRINVET